MFFSFVFFSPLQVNAISLAGEDSKDHAPIEYHPTRPSVMVVQCMKDSLGTTDARDVAQFVHEALGQQLAQCGNFDIILGNLGFMSLRACRVVYRSACAV